MAKNGSNLPAEVKKSGALQAPDFLGDAIRGYEGAGVSSKASDNLIPMVRILQDLSGEIKQRDPRYIEGAAVGDIYMSSIRKFWKGTEGLLFQPCAFNIGWVERIKREGGQGGDFVAQFQEPPEGTHQVDKNHWEYNDHDLVETRYHYGIIIGEGEDEGLNVPAVISMSSTGHTVSKAWTTLMNTHRLNGVIAPSFSRLYRVKTTLRRKGTNEWFIYDVSNFGWVPTQDQFEIGKALFDAVNVGDKVVDTSDMSNDAEPADKEVPF